jgi:hypothetical protein
MRFNKKAGTKLGMKELIEIVIAVAAVIILVLLLFRLFSPQFDPREETEESYFNILMEGITKADEEGTGQFEMPAIYEKGYGVDLVYFGENTRYEIVMDDGGIKKYFSFGNNENRLCICSYDWNIREGRCDNCINLEIPARHNNKEQEGWHIRDGKRIYIYLRGGKYRFETYLLLESGVDNFLGQSPGTLFGFKNVEGLLECHIKFTDISIKEYAYIFRSGEFKAYDFDKKVWSVVSSPSEFENKIKQELKTACEDL